MLLNKFMSRRYGHVGYPSASAGGNHHFIVLIIFRFLYSYGERNEIDPLYIEQTRIPSEAPDQSLTITAFEQRRFNRGNTQQSMNKPEPLDTTAERVAHPRSQHGSKSMAHGRIISQRTQSVWWLQSHTSEHVREGLLTEKSLPYPFMFYGCSVYHSIRG